MGRKIWEVIGLVCDGAFFCPDCAGGDGDSESVLLQDLESWAGSSCESCRWFIDPDGEWQSPDEASVLEEMEEAVNDTQ